METYNEILKSELQKLREIPRPKIDCKMCDQRPPWEYCCKEHYFYTRFDYKWARESIEPELMFKYFWINEKQKEEFIDAIKEISNLYY